MKRRPTPGVTSRPIDMTGAPKQGPSTDVRPSPGSLTPQKAVPGSGLNDDVTIEPVRPAAGVEETQRQHSGRNYRCFTRWRLTRKGQTLMREHASLMHGRQHGTPTLSDEESSPAYRQEVWLETSH